MGMKRFFIGISLLLLIFGQSVRADRAEDTAQRNEGLADYAALHGMVQDTEQPMFWLFVGDSITHGCLHTHGGRSFAEHWMEIIKWETMPKKGIRRTNDLVLNAGVSSETATGFLQQTQWRLQQFRPHVVFINFGINDETRYGDLDKFRTDLTAIVQLVRAQKAIPVLQTPSLTLRAKPMRPHYAAAIREVAAAENVLLVDHTAVWEELCGHSGASFSTSPASIAAPGELMNNDLHPNAAGHLLMAQTIARCLRLAPKNSPTMSRSTPLFKTR